ncbi:hypothetical protein N7535_006275 [Penicillium sp. DV-2018c]|nr:hypothetical protein N7535_006275 [Penicillium sp. DV-2018c]
MWMTRLLREWKSRRRRKLDDARERRSRSGEAADDFDLDPSSTPLNLHRGLTKVKSSLLTQARIGAIGLNAFLYRRQVPDIESPLCREGCAPETFAYLTLRCPQYAMQREPLTSLELVDRHSLRAALSRDGTAQRLATWFFGLGQLSENRLAKELECSDMRPHGNHMGESQRRRRRNMAL